MTEPHPDSALFLRTTPMKQKANQIQPPSPVRITQPKKIENRNRKWQERLLPLMINMLIALTVFFFIATFVQISYLHWSIFQYPSPNIVTPPTISISEDTGSFNEQLSAQKLYLLTRLEAYVVERRYREASVGLMTSIWFRYLGFITGMILALIGATFVLGKLQEPKSEISSKGSDLAFTLKTSSPGIILAVLGAALMLATILDKDTRNIIDAPTYISSISAEQVSLPTPLPVDTENLAAPEDKP
jgi:hypothetical protein